MEFNRIITLAQAVRHLSSAMENLRDNDRYPYFIISGAGISHPEVPTAAEIAESCMLMIGGNASQFTGNAAEQYSHWFFEAFPQRIDRQRYLQELIDKAKVTPANLYLAHLIAVGKLARLVVTPNFDNLLVRGLQLFGFTCKMCDHPYTVSRIDPQDEQVQIVHVHGGYQSYDIANLNEELAERSSIRDGDPVSIPDFLTSVLWERSPLVIGYSGWDNDVIMTVLERRLRTALPRN